MQNKEQDPPGHMADAIIIRNTVVGLKAVTDTHQQQQQQQQKPTKPKEAG